MTFGDTKNNPVEPVTPPGNPIYSLGFLLPEFVEVPKVNEKPVTPALAVIKANFCRIEL